MNRQRRALVLLALIFLWALGTARQLSAQGIPAACGSVVGKGWSFPKGFPAGNVGQRVANQMTSVRNAIGFEEVASPDEPPVQRPTLDSLWHDDSVAVEWDLALLAGTTEYANAYLASVASGEYARLSGKARPMLDVLLAGPSERQRAAGLSAIHHLSTPEEHSWTFLLACDAMWQFSALEADTVYRHLWRTEPRIWGFLTVGDVLTQATRLLSGSQRVAVVQFIPSVLHDLQPIDTLPSVDRGQ